ncbi:MAG: hypothetical protein M3203_12200, partial [Actinomycetota bacterium]|nr:hypothetical protein [Actinomycetota bacterium]
GAAWAAAGVAALWAALALLGASVLARWAVAVLVITTPVVLHASTTVTNDATGLVAGAAMLLAAVAWEKRRAPGFVVVLATVLGVSLRLTNFLGAGLVVVYLVLRALRRPADLEEADGRTSKSLLSMAAGVAGTVVVTGVAWVAFGSAVARVGPLANPNTFNQQADRLSLEMVLGQTGAAVTPIHDPYLAPFLRSGPVRTMADLTDWLVLGAAIGLAALACRGSRGEAVGVSTFLCAVATGPVLTVSNYVFQGAFYAIPPRYGLSLVPAFTVALGLALEKAWARIAVACLAGASAVLVLAAELR